MEPMPETVRAVEELGPFASPGDLLDDLCEMADRVVQVVPDCVGVSVASSEHGVTFTVLLDVVRRLDRVASSLCLPVGDRSGLAGEVNLYGASAGCFVGRHEQLADLLGGRAEAAVADADLSFSTRLDAADAPRRLLERSTVDLAAGLLGAFLDVDRPRAAARVDRAAARAGITVEQLAEALLNLRPD